jgi:mannose-6-phosphate isomerase
LFVGITNTPRDASWGTPGAISRLLDRKPSDRPEAELWFGTHPVSPSVLVDAQGPFAEVSGDLPYLLKVLAASESLSLQAHPNLDQARSGFEAEEAAGIPIDAPHRNYKDARHKPEMIYALEDGFGALCGFRPTEQTRSSLDRLARADPTGAIAALERRLPDDAALPGVFEWLITGGEGVAELITAVSAAAAVEGFGTQVVLARAFPGDAGIVISLLLNDVELSRGQVIYLPAGNIHAYQHGIGIELMAASDNVLRGGLTPKHVDVPELLRVLDFRTGPVPYLEPERPAPGVEVFRPDVPDFVLTVVSGDAELDRLDRAILLCVDGSFTVEDGDERRAIGRGDAVFARSNGPVVVRGSGRLFIASPGG